MNNGEEPCGCRVIAVESSRAERLVALLCSYLFRLLCNLSGVNVMVVSMNRQVQSQLPLLCGCCQVDAGFAGYLQ